MNILPYKLSKTNDQLTSRAGLLTIAHLMQSLQLGEHIDQVFPLPKSNRGIKPSAYLETLILMQHEGSFHLDDVRHLHDESALLSVLGMKQMPRSSALGDWLRCMGRQSIAFSGWKVVNRRILAAALQRKKSITLDIDATEIIANKRGAQWTYKKNRGYMPMVGHIAETGQVVACDFRAGNDSPAKENPEFIQHCQDNLPKGVHIKKLRIDAAGYQQKIIEYVDQQPIQYGIRAKMSRAVKEHIEQLSETNWRPMIHRNGEVSQSRQTYRMLHCIGDYDQPFTLVIQRIPLKGLASLDLDDADGQEQLEDSRYIYRAIATNRDDLSDSDIIHWYNQRGEDSENRIKELKHDFGGDTLPCTDFDANALYFHICALSYNLFALMRQLLPEKLAHHRAITLRWRLYGIAAKITRTARQLIIKVKDCHRRLFEQVLTALGSIESPPI